MNYLENTKMEVARHAKSVLLMVLLLSTSLRVHFTPFWGINTSIIVCDRPMHIRGDRVSLAICPDVTPLFTT